MKFAVIGGGISGLGALKVLKETGYEVVLFEKTSQLGGIWSVTYPGASLQNTKGEYYFPDFPASSTYKNFHPTKEEILEYIENYIKEFKLMDNIKLNHQISGIELLDSERWRVRVLNTTTHQSSEEIFDYVIIASGQYYDPPNIPQAIEEELKRKDRIFQGEILHDRQINSLDQLKGKKVVVIGYGKTALDLTTFSSELGEEAHIVFKEPRWLLPKKVFGAFSAAHVLLARHGQFFMDSWYLSPVQRFIQKYLPFIPWLFWRLLEMIFCISNGVSPWNPLIPRTRLVRELRSSAALTPPRFYQRIRAGKIKPHHSEVVGFITNGVKLKNGEVIQADLVITATGFKFNMDFLPPQFQNLRSSDGFHLYRHIIHPDIPHVAFAGFNHGLFHLPFVYMGMYWFIGTLRGIIKLPPKEIQRKEIEKIKEWKNNNILYESNRGSNVGPRIFSYTDEILADLGISSCRKSNLFSEWLLPYRSEDLVGIKHEFYEKLKKQT